MQKRNFSIQINTPKEKVWNIMLGDETYPKWTEPFAKDSYFKGDWSEGSKMLFLAPGENGEMGMVSRIKENRQYDFVSIEHIGFVQNGKEDTTSEEIKIWAGALENYKFNETENGTEVVIEIDVAEEYDDMFKEMWPKSLEILKELSEK